MDTLAELGLDGFIITIIAINLTLAMLMIMSLKFMSGLVCNVNATEELALKDNPAFGISLAGVALALAIMLTGVTSGKPSETPLQEVIIVATYGILGIILMGITRLVFDKIVMRQLVVREEILKRNMAIGIMDAGNVISTGLIVRAVMIWVESNSFDGIGTLLIAYLISQVLLTLAIFYRKQLYRMRMNGAEMEPNLVAGNSALALSFSGYRIGVAFAITAASNLIPYDTFDMTGMIQRWTVLSFALMCVISLFAYIAKRAILWNINTTDEVHNQSNIAIGAVEGVIYLAVGLILAGLLS